MSEIRKELLTEFSIRERKRSAPSAELPSVKGEKMREKGKKKKLTVAAVIAAILILGFAGIFLFTILMSTRINCQERAPIRAPDIAACFIYSS